MQVTSKSDQVTHHSETTKIWHHIQLTGDNPAPLKRFVWLHGWGQDHKSFSRLAKLSSDLGDHILFDLPGFGLTAMLEAGADTRGYADELFVQMKKMDTSGAPVILIGHSFGARIAVQMAAKYPESVSAIIIIAGAGLKRQRSLFWQLKALLLKSLGRLAKLSDRFFNTPYSDAYRHRFGSADYKNAGALRQTFVKTVNENLSIQARSLNCPVLLLYGSKDNETPIEIGYQFEKLIPVSRLEILEGFGHLDILNRGAYQLEAHIRTFLKDIVK